MRISAPFFAITTAALAAVVFLSGCGKKTGAGKDAPAVKESVTGKTTAWFQDVTEASGIHFIHDPGPRARDYYMPAMMGSGAALIDYDNDGRLDLLLLQNGGTASNSRNKLYHQESGGKFVDVSEGSGLDRAGFGMGVAVGDINNDGWPDVFITEFGGVHLFLNQKNGKFVEITTQAGIENAQWGASTGFVDYDRDGWLDLVVVNYVRYEPDKPCGGRSSIQDFCGPSSFEPTVTRLFRNLGKTADGSVAFKEMTASAGLSAAPGPGLGLLCADFNGDGWPDILVANDGRPNHLWINQKNGTFKEKAVAMGMAYDAMGQSQANMGIGLGDLDGDGLFDIYVTHLASEVNVCWRQGPAGVFTDRTAQMKFSSTHWRATGFGTALGDFDLDGDIDVAVANGAVKLAKAEIKSGDSFWGRYFERNQLLANDGKGGFTDFSENDPFCATAAIARGLAVGDIFGDGRLSLLVTRVGDSAQLFRNVAPTGHHWMEVRAVDPALGGRDAYGAEVRILAGGRRWKSWVNPCASYLCSNDPRAHFGLGTVAKIDSIEIAWPDGKSERFPGGDANKAVVLRKGTGSAL